MSQISGVGTDPGARKDGGPLKWALERSVRGAVHRGRCGVPAAAAGGRRDVTCIDDIDLHPASQPVRAPVVTAKLSEYNDYI